MRLLLQKPRARSLPISRRILGGHAVIAKLPEVLFVEALRRYIALLPPEQTEWLAGVRDPEAGRALALLHRRPAHPLDDCDARDRGRNIAFRTGRALPALSVRRRPLPT